MTAGEWEPCFERDGAVSYESPALISLGSLTDVTLGPCLGNGDDATLRISGVTFGCVNPDDPL